MLKLPPVESLFPDNRRGAIWWFWAGYWFWFFAFLPWMLLRQIGISFGHAVGTLATWNRTIDLLDGRLRIAFMNGLPAFVLTTTFGERFSAIQYRDVLIDPGPVFATKRLRRYLKSGPKVAAIAVTHAHEEHAGNAPLAARLTSAPVYASRFTLSAIESPAPISLPRRTFMGQPEPAGDAELRVVLPLLETPEAALEVIQSPGHCEGHASFFARREGVLFAGDSFLHTIFTAPNEDVSSSAWIDTLEAYLELDIRTMIGTHGLVYSLDQAVERVPFVVERRDPREMIRDKLAFMRWASAVVAEGERRELPYSVIEASLFPWQRFWSWQTWFTDEGGRLFSAGEFSRTYFVRSLSRTPERVPARFPLFARIFGRVRRE